MLLGFAVTDEIFAVAMSREREVSSQYFLGLAVLPYLGWTFGTLAGAVCGNILPQNISDALGLAIYGMFIAIIVPAMKKDSRILKITLLAVALSCLLQWAPVFAGLGSGFVIIICTLLAAAFAAWKFPVKEAEADE